MQEKIEFFLRCLLKDKELYIFREIYGIGCFEREKGEIANEIGMSLEEIERAQNKFLIKIDDAMTKYPDYVLIAGKDALKSPWILSYFDMDIILGNIFPKADHWEPARFGAKCSTGFKHLMFPKMVVGLIMGTINPLTIGIDAENQRVYSFCCQS